MGIIAQQSCAFTPDEYLALERAAEYKSEYLDGQIYPYSGCKANYCLIAANLISEVCGQCKGKPYQTYNSQLKVRDSSGSLFAYPVLTVGGGELILHDEEEDVLVNPILIVEVVSPTNEAFIQGRKWAQYQSIASLQTYVLVAQDRARIEQYVRQPDDTWLLSTAAGLDKSIYLASIDCTLALSEVYDGIDFNPAPSVYPA